MFGGAFVGDGGPGDARRLGSHRTQEAAAFAVAGHHVTRSGAPGVTAMQLRFMLAALAGKPTSVQDCPPLVERKEPGGGGSHRRCPGWWGGIPRRGKRMPLVPEPKLQFARVGGDEHAVAGSGHDEVAVVGRDQHAAHGEVALPAGSYEMDQLSPPSVVLRMPKP